MNTEQFVSRHISLNEADKQAMLEKLGVSSIEELISQTIPSSIRLEQDLEISEAFSEYEMLNHSKELASKMLITRVISGLDTIIHSCLQRFREISLKTQAGIRHTLHTRRKLHREDWKLFLISRR